MEEALPAAGSPLGHGKPEEGRPMVPLGLHGDGVPRYVAGRETIEAVQQVIAWSLQSLGEGRYPSCRHDGGSMDKARQNAAGRPMAARAGLVQLRGDWDWNCKYFGVPQWNELAGTCWLCKAKPENWRGMSAKDRKNQSLSKAEFEESLRARKKHVSPLFGAPGVCNKTMKPDWMHVVDEGCGSHAAGQVLKELLALFPDRSVEKRADRLGKRYRACMRRKELQPAEGLRSSRPKT